ncbi:uncharacterized protein [Coffea arabica]|uniref:Transmembrane protein n=1 Tax=Coffea arabica TaxID=13443 RepID=A0ABM4UZ31_COFAR
MAEVTIFEGIRAQNLTFTENLRLLGVQLWQVLNNNRRSLLGIAQFTLLAVGWVMFAFFTDDGNRIEGIIMPEYEYFGAATFLTFAGTIGCYCSLLVLWLTQKLIHCLRQCGFNGLSSSVTFVASAIFSAWYLFLSAFLGLCVVEDVTSFDAMVAITWGLFVSMLFLELPDDFGLTDSFVAANFGIAIKLSASHSICPSKLFAMHLSTATCSLELFAMSPSTAPSTSPGLVVLKRIAIAFTPLLAKMVVTRVLGLWTHRQEEELVAGFADASPE